jgi:hypothetical protein
MARKKTPPEYGESDYDRYQFRGSRIRSYHEG